MGGYVEWYFEWDAQDWVSERTSLTIVCVCAVGLVLLSVCVYILYDLMVYLAGYLYLT